MESFTGIFELRMHDAGLCYQIRIIYFTKVSKIKLSHSHVISIPCCHYISRKM